MSNIVKEVLWAINGLLKALPPESRAALKATKAGDTLTIGITPDQYTDANGNPKTGDNLPSVELGTLAVGGTTSAASAANTTPKKTWESKDDTGFLDVIEMEEYE